MLALDRHQMSLYASVTGIKWDFTGASIAGGNVAQYVSPVSRSRLPRITDSSARCPCLRLIDIIVPAKQLVVRFEIDSALRHFDAANALWDKIDEAFEDIDSDL